MQSISYTKARAKLSSVMDQVSQNHDSIIITRKDNKPVVMISLEDFNAMEETAYLMRSPKNAMRIEEAVSDLKSKENFKKHDLR